MNISKKLLMLAAGLGLVALVGTSCATGTAVAQGPKYSPQSRQFQIAAVPQLVHEQSGTFDFLQKAFAKHGLLDGHEIWGFSQSNLVVYQWDPVDVNLLNVGDDPHTFTITELGVNAELKPNAQSKADFVASKVGTFRFFCSIPEHAPWMSGTITVLPDSAAQ